MRSSSDLFSNISFQLKSENGEKVSINAQNFTFRLSLKEV